MINIYENKKLDKYKLNNPNPGFNIHKMKLPFRCLLVGPSGSGKGVVLINLLKAFNNTF